MKKNSKRIPLGTKLEYLNKAMVLKNQGLQYHEIAGHLNLRISYVKYLLTKVTTNEIHHKKCMNKDCNKEFTTRQSHRLFCCNKCAKNWAILEKIKNEPKRICVRPGCQNEIPRFRKKYCSYHCDKLDQRRWAMSSTNLNHLIYGMYRKIIIKKPACIACGEWRTIQDHHTIFIKGKSDKSSPTVCLCPTHHKLIHNGFAEIRDGKYIELIKKDLETKQNESLKKAIIAWENPTIENVMSFAKQRASHTIKQVKVTSKNYNSWTVAKNVTGFSQISPM